MKKAYLIAAFLLFATGIFAGNDLPRCGIASYYGRKANHRRTACGERLCNDSFTAAYKTYPFGTYLKVTNLKNDRITIVRINDRGPHRRKRIIDLSYAAARKIRLMNCGLAQVRVELATPEEIKDKDKLNTDSLSTDSSGTEKSIDSIKEGRDPGKKFNIQAGIFRLKNSAFNLKAYLMHRNVTNVAVNQINLKGHLCYKVIIGPIDTIEKETTLRILRGKHIKGLVTALNPKKKHHSKR